MIDTLKKCIYGRETLTFIPEKLSYKSEEYFLSKLYSKVYMLVGEVQ